MFLAPLTAYVLWHTFRVLCSRHITFEAPYYWYESVFLTPGGSSSGRRAETELR
jgi:hypothetical protein